MATENVLMDAVRRGGDRQALHERIRVHSVAAAQEVKANGGRNDLVDRIAADPAFGVTKEEIEALLLPENFVGMAPSQTRKFLEEEVKPVLRANENEIAAEDAVTV